MKKYIIGLTIITLLAAIVSCLYHKNKPLISEEDTRSVVEQDRLSVFHVPVKQITTLPGFHWFAYYDKLQCDPSGRYALGMRTDFEHRSPTAEDEIEIGMVDLKEECRWIPLNKTRSWGWQQGCQLQFIPGSKEEIIWNDREGNRFVARIMNIKTRKIRTLDASVYALSPDGKSAITTDYRRINDTRPGYGYAGVSDPNKGVLAPDNSGIWQVDLQTGQSKLIISMAQVAAIPNPLEDFSKAKHWFNHLLVNPDGSRLVFLHRWRYPDAERNAQYEEVGGFGTRMLTANMDGSDIRVIDGYNYTSHFIWRDTRHLLAWTRLPEAGFGFFLFEDTPEGKVEQIGQEAMPLNGHCTYIRNGEWILNDTYPDKNTRLQSVYLYHIKSGRRIPLADLYSPEEYQGEWRTDTHPRSTPDGNYVIVDSPNLHGRQMYLLDISDIN